MNTALPAVPTEILTLVDLLRWRAASQPDYPAYTFLLDGETATDPLTYQALDQQARAIAGLLQQHCAPGDRALLLYPPGLAYLAAFFGCLYAGVLAVPAYPPNPARLARTMPRLQAIIDNARPVVALTTAAIAEAAGRVAAAPALTTMRWLTTDTLDPTLPLWTPPALSERSLAFLQYTSGSTATPKGVMLSHANLLHNSALIAQAFGHTPASRGVIWLPPYHDMGLIGGLLQPLYSGFPVTLMAPVDFLQRPLRWLQAISRFRATTSGGPNFAYDLCVQTITPEQRAALDLSSWAVAFNGAEPVRAATIQRFAETFAPCGFDASAFYPCYGLAEATLIVSGGTIADAPISRSFALRELEQHRVVEVGPGEGRTLVSSGQVLASQQLAIVDPTTRRRCTAQQTGEIWLAGPSVAQGYLEQPDATAQTFGAQIADEPGGPYLRTGDLGFMVAGELFVTGRLNDMIILRGRNYYPQDIEQTVERCHPALRPASGAAFAVEEDGQERLVVAHELERSQRHTDSAAVIAAIRHAVMLEHDLAVHTVVLLKPGGMPKTSSGKVQRYLCRQRYLSDVLEPIGQSSLEQPATAPATTLTGDELRAAPQAARQQLLARYLHALTSARLGKDVSAPGQAVSLLALGLDSLQAVELQHRLEADLGLLVPIARLLEDQSVDQLAAVCLELLDAPLDHMIQPELSVSAARDTLYPLSAGQHALWFLHQLAPASAAYNLVSAMRLRGALDVAALRRAVEQLMARHAALRTTFETLDDTPVQRTNPVSLVFDVHQMPGADAAKLAAQLRDLSQQPFDLRVGPLLRVHLFQTSDRDAIMVLMVHHIVADLWSLSLLIRELSSLYLAERTGQPAPLAPLAQSYADVVRWQESLLADAAAERLWRYWLGQLAAAPAALDLPTDRVRPAVQTDRGAAHTFRLSAELTGRLSGLAQRAGATLYMTLLAAFDVLLYRYTGQTDLLVGTPTSGRSRAGMAGIVGYFVNPVALRAQLFDTQPFSALLAQVRQTVLDALAHQELPFPLLVERLQPERDPSRSPLFQVMFMLQQTPLAEAVDLAAFALGSDGVRLRLDDLELESIALEQQTAQFDLTLSMAEHHGALIGVLQYNRDLFEPATIRRMAGHFETLLQSITVGPDQPIAELALLDQRERQALLGWSAASSYPHARCIHEMFEAQVARTPDSIALIADTTRLSYAELNHRSDQLAQRLRALGVGGQLPAETRIGVCLTRTPQLVVSLLGVLKAGGAYVPLDPTYPRERLALMIDDAAIAMILTEMSLIERLPGSAAAGPVVVCLDRDEPPITGSVAAARRPVMPDQLAYILYTSGSTGTPKGVALSHRNAASLIGWAQQTFPLDQLRGTLAATSINFDLSVFELFTPLSAGGTVVLADQILQLEQLPAANEVTLVNTVPSAIAELLQLDGLPSSVQVVNLAGEPLPLRLAQQLYQRDHVRQVVNLYGPTEVTTYATSAVIDPDDPAPPPIGRPIGNTQAYVLDGRMALVPVGVIGELYLGGAGVARGYWGQAGRTAARFVPDGLSGAAGGRLYRTGDLVRWRADGQLAFVGRRDGQVKLRGFRIELGEIETVLAGHAAVREVAVLVRADGGGERRLVAYVVGAPSTEEQGNTGPALQPAELRAFLRTRLPEYMVPSAFVLLPALPLTPNGKLDRQALPAPAPLERDRELTPPRSAVEERLVAIWRDVLGVDQVGVEDNFFTLGGHSLLVTRVVSRVRDAFQIELPLQQLFGTPTVAGLAAAIEALRTSVGPVARDQISAVPRDGAGLVFPTSFAQRRLWFLAQWFPRSAAYHVPLVVALRGPLDVAALAHSLQALVARHEALRTTFQLVEGQPAQRIAPAQPLDLPVHDLRAEAPAARATARQALRTRYLAQPFDLAAGPLLRAGLVRLGEAEYELLLCLHHISVDGWGLGVLVRELRALYGAARQGRAAELPTLRVQYADYAAWQRGWLTAAVRAPLLAYWQQQLAGLTPLALPTDHLRPAVLSLAGARQPIRLERALVAALERLSREADVTLFMTLLALFQVLLQRYSGQDDIAVGTPIANRTRVESEQLVGCLVNTLVLRVDLGGAPTFRSLLERVRAVCLDAYAHQDLPFELIVDQLQPERDLSRTPLFQVMFALQDVSPAELSLADVDAELLPIDTGTAKFDLTLDLSPDAHGGLSGFFEYATDLFEPATIARMVTHFETLLHSAVVDPDQITGDLAILPPDERQRMLVAWNATSAAYPADQTIAALFEAQAARTPAALAVAGADRRLSYAELDARANQLACHLRALGVGPDRRVGVCLQRSPELLVGLLGVLKAGGAYIPLDPAYPPERLQYMLHDSAASLLLTEQTLHDAQPALRDLRARTGLADAATVLLDRDWPTIAQQPATRPINAVDPTNLAYLIYTSGSTGAPKGVALTHRNAVALIDWARTVFAPSELAGVLASTAISFDLSVFELFVTLSWGGTVVLAENALRWPPCPTPAITLVNTVPSAIAELLRLDLLPASVTTVNLAGEPLSADLVARLYACSHIQRVYNLYGPSEDTTYSTYALQLRQDAHAPPIGRPIGNTQAYVLDGRMALVPVGVIGELYLGGAGVARGYWGQAGRTAAQFVPDGLSGAAGGRLYRTGDLVRWRADGQLAFVGRRDGQVKLRGFRIELGEIETVLAGHAAVREVAVLVRAADGGGRRLVAYIVPAEPSREHDAAGAAELRAFLRTRLPEYMVPSAFVVLPALPLTPNGKLDRQALPAPALLDQPDHASSTAIPATPDEEIMAGIWGELLGRSAIGRDDNFFALGGHSLLATQLIAQVRDLFRVELPLQSVFDHPTVAALTAQLTALRSQQVGLIAPPLRPLPRTTALPLSFAQQRLWLLDQITPGSAAYHVPLVVALRGPLDVAALAHSLSTLVARHETLRTTFQLVAGQPVQRIAPAQPLAVPVHDLRAEAPAARATARQALRLRYLVQPFDLTTGPLLRAGLVRLGEAEYELLLCLHHISVDGWGLGVLVRELRALYEAARQGRAAELPGLRVQYADYAAWQRGWLTAAVRAPLLAYWRQQLAGLTPLALPIDHPRPAPPTFRAAEQPLSLSAELSAALVRLSREAAATLFMTLLAALDVLLYWYTQQEDIVVGADIANRTQAETADLIGFFVNLLALRVDLSGDPTFRSLLERVRAVCLQAYAHQELPFDLLVNELQPQRSLERAPLFQVVLVLQNTPMPSLDLDQLTVEPLAVDPGVAKFDLVVELREDATGLTGVFKYDTDLFESATIARMIEQYRALLTLAVEQPDAPLHAIKDHLDEAQRQQQIGQARELRAQQQRRIKDIRRRTLSDG